ncbi:hypothetical protein [Clostridium sp. AWRP]|nr:hypothetical protein [Clostridium sp. AWRP]
MNTLNIIQVILLYTLFCLLNNSSFSIIKKFNGKVTAIFKYKGKNYKE